MKLIIESTSRVVNVNGVPGRIWEGETDGGIPVAVLITRVGVHKEQDQARFEHDLQAAPAPEPTRMAREAFPARMVL